MEQKSGRGSTQALHGSALQSLAGVLVVAVLTSIHHAWRIGAGAVALGGVLVAVPLLSMLAWRRSRSPWALAVYAVAAGWIVIGFGLIDGMWDSTLKLFFGNFLLADHGVRFSWQPVGSFAFEATGVLASAAALYAGWQLVRFVAAARGVLRACGRARAALHVPWVAVAILGAATVAFAASRQPGPAAALPEVVKIGVIVPDDPGVALLGSSFLKAVQLAVEDVQQLPTKHRYEIVVERSSVANPLRTKAAIQKLVVADRVQAIVGGISLSGQIVKPYAAAARLPHICVCTVESIGDGAYNFTLISLPRDDATAWAQEASRRKAGRVAILTAAYPSIDGHVAALKKELGARGIPVATELRFDPGVRDFGPVVAKARASGADTWFVEAMMPALDLLGAEVQRARVANVTSFVAPSLSDHPELFEGAWYVDTNLADARLRDRFEQRFAGTRFATHMMPFAYDAVRLLVQGFESEAGAPRYLQDLRSYRSGAGTVTKEAGSGNFRPLPGIWEIRGAHPVLVRSPDDH